MEKEQLTHGNVMDNIELIVINKWKKWGKTEFVHLWITDVRLDDMTKDVAY